MSEPETQDAPRRKRGGPAGSRSALRHGLYARNFHQHELSDLDAINLQISDEIVLLRVMTRRLIEYANTAELDVREMIALLNTLGTTAIRIANLCRTANQLNGDSGDDGAALSRALAEVYKELHIE